MAEILAKVESQLRPTALPEPRCEVESLLGERASAQTVIRHDASSNSWLLIAPTSAASTLVNGRPLHLGLRVLRDRDLIRLSCGAQIFFSNARPAVIEPYGGDGSIDCRRCGGKIEPSQASVTCPGCGAVHHEDEQLTCWTYARRCAGCAQSTDMNIEHAWMPEMW